MNEIIQKEEVSALVVCSVVGFVVTLFFLITVEFFGLIGVLSLPVWMVFGRLVVRGVDNVV